MVTLLIVVSVLTTFLVYQASPRRKMFAAGQTNHLKIDWLYFDYKDHTHTLNLTLHFDRLYV